HTPRSRPRPRGSLGIGAGTPSSLTLRYRGSTSSRAQPRQSGAPRLELEALNLQRSEAGHSEASHAQSPEHAASTSSALPADSTVSIDQLPETLQAPWAQLTLKIDQDDQDDQDDQEALAALFTKSIKSRKAFKESEQPRAMLNKCAASAEPVLFDSVTTIEGPKAIRWRRWHTRMQGV
ncbi:MAG: hypothetical protein Q9192_009003, partial [Flavoplaca navasiana]